MTKTADTRRLVRLSPLILCAAIILFTVSSAQLMGFRVETDKNVPLHGDAGGQ